MQVQRNSRSTSPDWPDLLRELLAVTAKRLTSIYDYISFRGVCDSWRFAATFDNFDHSFPQVPWLMYPVMETMPKRLEGRYSPSVYVTTFVDLSKNRTFRIPDFPVEEELKTYFSCNGWVLGVTKSSVHIHLTHPIRRIQIKLPDLDTFPEFTNNLSKSRCFISKMALSSRPTVKPDFVIIVIWGEKGQLGFSRPGDSSWTVMELWNDSFMDIAYHKGKLYAIDNNYTVVECDIYSHNPTRMQQVFKLPNLDDYIYMKYYMVASSGKLLFLPIGFYLDQYRVFEFDLVDGSHKEIFDMGNKTLFLSPNSSLCLENFAWNDKVEPNCIYLAEWGLCFRLGNLRAKKFLQGHSSCIFNWPASTWVVPGF